MRSERRLSAMAPTDLAERLAQAAKPSAEALRLP
jgi:hypothetical protein